MVDTHALWICIGLHTCSIQMKVFTRSFYNQMQRKNGILNFIFMSRARAFLKEMIHLPH